MKSVLLTACLAMLALGGCDDTGNTEGTYQGATGYDPSTANMSMCSDGAMREDCSDAPEGY